MFDAIILGGGPAGAAAALQIARRDRARAKRCLLLDAAIFPREKLCGGGVTGEAYQLLACLGVEPDVPSVAIDDVFFQYEGGEVRQPMPGFLRIVRRDEFDAYLLAQVARSGVAVHQGEAAQHFERRDDCIVVHTERGSYAGRSLIGADGARSRVRKELVGDTRDESFVALEVLTTEVATPAPGASAQLDSKTAVFDFRPMKEGVRGYRWHFPSLLAGTPTMNRGIVGSTRQRTRGLGESLRRGVEERGAHFDRSAVQGSTVPHYDPQRAQSAERVLLAGDAVGIDPLFGEGIAAAIGTGILAGHAVCTACEDDDFSFTDYRERIQRSAIGEQLLQRSQVAEAFYASNPKDLIENLLS